MVQFYLFIWGSLILCKLALNELCIWGWLWTPDLLSSVELLGLHGMRHYTHLVSAQFSVWSIGKLILKDCDPITMRCAFIPGKSSKDGTKDSNPQSSTKEQKNAFQFRAKSSLNRPLWFKRKYRDAVKFKVKSPQQQLHCFLLIISWSHADFTSLFFLNTGHFVNTVHL